MCILLNCHFLEYLDQDHVNVFLADTCDELHGYELKFNKHTHIHYSFSPFKMKFHL